MKCNRCIKKSGKSLIVRAALVLLAFVMAVPLGFSSFAATDEAGGVYAGNALIGSEIALTSAARGGTIVSSLINGTGSEAKGKFLLTVYDENGKLADLKIGEELSVAAGETAHEIYIADILKYPLDECEYRAYFWNADNVPLAAAVSISGEADEDSLITLNWETYPLVVGGRTPADMLGYGDFFDLEAAVAPPLGPDAEITWISTDPDIVKVSDTGRIKAVRTGFADVIALLENGDFSVCHVSCIDNYDRATVRYVTLNTDLLELSPGSSAPLTPAIYPVGAYNLNASFTAAQNTRTWTSSNEAVAVVSADGTVTAVAPGVAVITVTSDQIVARKAQCRVVVGESAASGISLDKSALDLKWGQTAKLTADIIGSTIIGSSEKKVSWSSSNQTIADVDKDGNVTAYSSGTAVITATSVDGGFTAACTVSVTGVPVEAISVGLNRDHLNLAAGSVSFLTAVVVPSSATDQTITWSSSNPDVVKVAEGADTTIFNAPVGSLTAVSPGTAIITARCGDVTATCPITVTAAVVPAAQVLFDKTALSLEPDAVVTLEAQVKPADTTDESLFWVSTDTHVASVSLDGIVKAYAPGTTTIVAVPKSFVVNDPLLPSFLDAQEIVDSEVFSAKLAEIISKYPTASCVVTVSTPAGSTYLRNIVAPAEAITPNSANLLWNRSSLLYAEGFEAYRIYVNGQLRDTVTTLGYTVKGLKPGTEYTFKVEAVKTGGEIARAQSINVTTKPDYTAVINVTKAPYNAVGNGKVTDTYAIQRAINDCPENGLVLLPEGYVFWSGALFLKSDMTLKVDGILIGSIEGKDYPKMNTRWEGWRKVDKGYVVDNTANPKQLNERAHASLITIGTYDEGDNSAYGPFNVSNVSIIGKGQVNANGQRLCYTELDRTGTRTNSSRVRGRTITSHNVSGLYVADIGIAWSPSWTTHLIYSENATFDHCLVIGSGTGLVTSGKSRPAQLVAELVREHGSAAGSGSRSCVINGDGIDPDSSRNFNVFRVLFSAGDDAMAMKSGRNGQGFDLNKPLAYIRVTDCHVQNSDGGLAIGSEDGGGAHDILFQNLTMENVSLHGLWIKTMWARGGVFENIDFKDSWMTGIDANVILMEYRYSSSTSVPARTVPVMRRLNFENCHGSGINGRGFGFRGTPATGMNTTTRLITENTILSESSRVNGAVVRPLGYVQDVIMKGCSLTGRVTNTSADNQACIHVADNFDIYDTELSAFKGSTGTDPVVWTYGSSAIEAGLATRIRIHDELPGEFVRLKEKGKTREEMYPYYLSESLDTYYKDYNSMNTLYPLYPY